MAVVSEIDKIKRSLLVLETNRPLPKETEIREYDASERMINSNQKQIDEI